MFVKTNFTRFVCNFSRPQRISYQNTIEQLRFDASLPEARCARVAAHFSRVLAQQIHPFGGFMKLKVVVCLLAFASLFSIAASAQDVPKFDLFAGYSYVRANPGTSGIDGFNLHGGSASIAYNANSWLSGVADFGGYHSN